MYIYICIYIYIHLNIYLYIFIIYCLYYNIYIYIKNLYPTTSFLTAATLIYTIGAGITAAAGTRLALQLLLDIIFTLLLIPNISS